MVRPLDGKRSGRDIAQPTNQDGSARALDTISFQGVHFQKVDLSFACADSPVPEKAILWPGSPRSIQLKALISDIHGNLEALRAVLEDINKHQVEEIYCLGDVIGYGPNPRECIDLIMK